MAGGVGSGIGGGVGSGTITGPGTGDGTGVGSVGCSSFTWVSYPAAAAGNPSAGGELNQRGLPAGRHRHAVRDQERGEVMREQAPEVLA